MGAPTRPDPATAAAFAAGVVAAVVMAVCSGLGTPGTVLASGVVAGLVGVVVLTAARAARTTGQVSPVAVVAVAAPDPRHTSTGVLLPVADPAAGGRPRPRAPGR